MRNSLRKKIFILGFPLLSAVLITVSLVTKGDDFDTRSSASETPVSTSGIPQVVSVNPSTATVGEPFTYYLRIVDSDNELDDLEVSVSEAPSWMIFDEENYVLYGTPVLYDSDTQKVVLELSDGINDIEYKFYLLILDDNRQDN